MAKTGPRRGLWSPLQLFNRLGGARSPKHKGFKTHLIRFRRDLFELAVKDVIDFWPYLHERQLLEFRKPSYAIIEVMEAFMSGIRIVGNPRDWIIQQKNWIMLDEEYLERAKLFASIPGNNPKTLRRSLSRALLKEKRFDHNSISCRRQQKSTTPAKSLSPE